jgi:hypothetical protein
MRRGIASLLALASTLVVTAMLTASAYAAQTAAGIAIDPILQPPNQADGKPIEVVIGLHVVNLAAIDEVSEQFQLDAYMPRNGSTSGWHSRRRGRKTRSAVTGRARCGRLSWR